MREARFEAFTLPARAFSNDVLPLPLGPMMASCVCVCAGGERREALEERGEASRSCVCARRRERR